MSLTFLKRKFAQKNRPARILGELFPDVPFEESGSKWPRAELLDAVCTEETIPAASENVPDLVTRASQQRPSLGAAFC